MKYILLIALIVGIYTDNASTVWNKLVGAGLTKAGAAGMMGNLQAESGMQSVIYENAYKGKVGLSDQEIIHSLIKKIEQLEKELNELKQQNENNMNKHKKRYDINSDILNNKEHIDLLYNRLENNLYLKHKDFHLRRIYNSNNDGRYIKDLYEKCDRKKMILLVYESDEGFKFGGFIQEFVVLEEYNKFRTEHNNNNEDFIFSLDDMKVYNAVYNDRNIRSQNLGHLRIFKDTFYFEYAICCSESKGKSFLDDCSVRGESANEYWGGVDLLNKLPQNSYTRIKTLEAFQVIIDKNELN